MLSINTSKKVVIVGDASVDIIVQYPIFLNDKRTNVEYRTPYLIGGGTAANTAVALSRLGIDTSFIGTVGNDQYGRYIIDDFNKEHVGIENLTVDNDVNTVGVFAFVDEHGERYLWGWPRTKQSFKKLELENVDFNLIRDADWIHSTGMVFVDDTSARSTILSIFKFAKENGIKTSFDLNLRVNNGKIDEDYRNSILSIVELSNVVLGSAEEEIFYLGNHADWIGTARDLAQDNRIVIARLGSNGSMAFTSNEEFYADAFSVDVVDTIGAGDVYNAGFIAAQISGHSIQESTEWGNALSGYTVAKEGARSSPTIENLESFVNLHGRKIS